MKVKQVMTPEVQTVTPSTPLKVVATMLAEGRISGLPVCDESGDVVGVLSEGDIVRYEGGKVERAALVRLLTGGDGPPVARTAGEAMSSPAVTIGPERPVAAAARLMIERKVNRLPVVRDGELVGIVTRADLVRAFLRSDEAIARELREDVLERTLWLSDDALRIDVEGGEVTISGEVPRRSDAEVVLGLARRVPGVVSVEVNLAWRTDDKARLVSHSPV